MADIGYAELAAIDDGARVVAAVDFGNVAGAQWELDGRRVVLSATSGAEGTSQVLIAHTAAP